MKKLLQKMRSQRGATMIEYALIVTLIAIAAITAVSLVGDRVTNAFNTIANQLPTTSN